MKQNSNHRRTDVPSRSDQVFGLDLACPNLPTLGALLDILDQFLFLTLQLDALPIQFALCPIQSPLVLAKTLRRRHAFSKCPLDDLPTGP